MNYFSLKKSNSFHKNKRKNLNLLARFELESLESRVTPAELLVNSLLFRGNLVENNGIFSTPNSAIEVGYNPGRTRHKSLPSKNHLTVVHIPPRKESFVFDSHFFCFIGLKHV